MEKSNRFLRVHQLSWRFIVIHHVQEIKVFYVHHVLMVHHGGFKTHDFIEATMEIQEINSRRWTLTITNFNGIWDVNGNLENSIDIPNPIDMGISSLDFRHLELAAFVMGFRGSQWCERHFSEAPERDWGPHAGGEIQLSLLVHLRYLPKEHVLAGWPSFCLVYLPVIRSDIEDGWKLICPWKILTLMIFHGYVNLLEGTWCFWKSRNELSEPRDKTSIIYDSIKALYATISLTKHYQGLRPPLNLPTSWFVVVVSLPTWFSSVVNLILGDSLFLGLPH